MVGGSRGDWHLHAVAASEDVVDVVVREQDVLGPLEGLGLVLLNPEYLGTREACRLPRSRGQLFNQ